MLSVVTHNIMYNISKTLSKSYLNVKPAIYFRSFKNEYLLKIYSKQFFLQYYMFCTTYLTVTFFYCNPVAQMLSSGIRAVSRRAFGEKCLYCLHCTVVPFTVSHMGSPKAGVNSRRRGGC